MGETKLVALLNTVEEDPCCARRLGKALLKNGEITEWVCPSCGCEWKPTDGQTRHWKAQWWVSVSRAR